MKKEFGNTNPFTTQDVNRILAGNTSDITLTPEGLAYLGVLPHQPILMHLPFSLPALETARLVKRAM